jgi:hypothetical protein
VRIGLAVAAAVGISFPLHWFACASQVVGAIVRSQLKCRQGLRFGAKLFDFIGAVNCLVAG